MGGSALSWETVPRNTQVLAIPTFGLERLCCRSLCLNGTFSTLPATITDHQRQFSVINNRKSQGCVLMPEMGGRLSSGVSDTALASSGASCVAMLADRHEKVGCCECSQLACGAL